MRGYVCNECRTNLKKESWMSLMDPEDQEFGHKAAEDQEVVDALEERGLTEEDLPDEQPVNGPRAGRKAEP
jgi:hypothetical protein